MKVTVLGCGRWGTFLAWYADKMGHSTTLWGRKNSARLDELRRLRHNDYIALPSTLKLSDDLGESLKDADYVIISINAQNLRDLLAQVRQCNAKLDRQIFVLCMKGLESGTGKRLTTVFQEVMDSERVAIWVGPGHVQSFVAGVPNCMVIDAKDTALQNAVVDTFGSDLIRFYYGTDIIGNEIGAATKNVIGIAAGMLDGLGWPALKGALMARAPRELARLITALGGNAQSSYGLAHLGDYVATLFSPHSHNRRFGEDFVTGKSFARLAEGVPTLDALTYLSEQYDVELPICSCVRSVLINHKNPKYELNCLFARPIKREFI